MKSAAQFLLWLAGAYLALVALVFLAQRSLLYLPAGATLDEIARGGLQPWPSAADFRGLVAEPAAPARATAIVLHGNAGHAGHRDFYAAALAPLGWRVILAEYPGYGARRGETGEAAFAADARETIRLAHRQYGEPLVVIGESLGAGVAASALAAGELPVAGLWLITPWDRLERVAAHHYFWLPVRWLLRDRYDSVVHLAAYRGPVLVTLAERDGIVPARFGRALFDALPGPKRLSVVTGADHNDWASRLDERGWREAAGFVLGGLQAR